VGLRLENYPQLKMIAWQRDVNALVEEQEAFALYERNWQYVEKDALIPEEKYLIHRLTNEFGHGVMNV